MNRAYGRLRRASITRLSRAIDCAVSASICANEFTNLSDCGPITITDPRVIAQPSRIDQSRFVALPRSESNTTHQRGLQKLHERLLFGRGTELGNRPRTSSWYDSEPGCRYIDLRSLQGAASRGLPAVDAACSSIQVVLNFEMACVRYVWNTGALSNVAAEQGIWIDFVPHQPQLGHLMRFAPWWSCLSAGVICCLLRI